MLCEEAIKKINESIMECYLVDREDKCTGIICLVCDRFIKPRSMKTIEIDSLVKNEMIFKANSEYHFHQSIRNQYKIKLKEEHEEAGSELLTNCMLSPRSQYIEYDDKRNISGYTICTTCNNYVSVGKKPIFSISNNICRPYRNEKYF